ncbi:MAG: metallophosphoesterase family protein [Acutalibacteraceae bacterium]
MNQEKQYRKMQQALAEKEAQIPVPATDDPILLDENAELNLVLWGDPQVSFLSPLRSMYIAAACRDLGNAVGTADALILLGDITEYGMECEFRTVKDLLHTCETKFAHLLCIPGNHDVRLRRYKHQRRKFQDFLRTAPHGAAGPEGSYFQTLQIKGYTFILLGTDRATFEGAYFGTEQLRKLDEAIAAAKGKPVFVLNHQTLKRTNGLPNTWLGKGKWRGSVGWDSDKLKAVLQKHSNVFYLTGHLHWTTNEHTYEDHGGFKALSVPAVGPSNHGPVPEQQSYILSVYKDKIVARARFCAKGKYMDKSVPNAEIILPLP